MKGKVILGEEDFNLEELKKQAIKEESTAVVTYSDIVQKEREGVNVRTLEVRIYEGMTENEMKRVKDEIIKQFDISFLAIVQRYGLLEAGENIFGIVISASDKEEALEAGVNCLDRFNSYVPLWKKETTIEGEERWVEKADELHSLYNRMVKWI
uniref:Molybdopterin-converting factor subunit 2 n=1 Tax=uncultured organism TaxID=155900 RepID=M1Q1B9_9ZZZZ|nr:molybdopterin-converting factor subunit 2 [uncultured organism]